MSGVNIEYYLFKVLKKLRFKAVKNSSVHKSSKIESGSEVVNSTFAKYSFCGYNCEIINTDIGSFCSIANHVIIGGGMHPYSWVSTSPTFYIGRDSVKKKFSEHIRETPLRTSIGNDVWIGERAIIKQGVKIGDGAVVGMGSVVTKDVMPYEIVGGCPAKVLKMRFKDSVVNALMELKWWELNDKEIQELAKFIKTPEIFIKKFNIR